MASFKKVALLGKGYLGSVVVEELVKAQFEVTVVTRSQSTVEGIKSSVAIKEVDYSSIESLKAALEGHDVVVSTLNPGGIPLQKTAIDASIAVGVRRFIPADFGSITTDPEAQNLPVLGHVVAIQKYLAEKANAGDIEWTIFAVGGFLELLFTKPVAVDFEKRTATLFDGGDHPVSVSSTATVGKAIAGALKKPEETKNRVVHVHDIILTQRKVLELAKKLDPGRTWTETALDGSAELESHLQRLRSEGMSPAIFAGIFRAALFSGKYGTAYHNVDNDLLGLGFKTDEEVERLAVDLLNFEP
ncbi:hypothetical protein BJY01DRAFT_234143 [Aspergillus pseudoustus]|uniref:NAD(P)-binding domain-containing protein n=1 Tax=Aspergillus pseudoustus TaxID=1810923 RepID=A0ABR4K6U2_9EURO